MSHSDNEKKESSLYEIKTRDHISLYLKRYKPIKKKVAHIPVVLCHGLLANKHSLDFGEQGSKEWDQYSLASFLYKGGEKKNTAFDVWVPELRGRRSYLEYDASKWDQVARLGHWCFDDYVDYDVPAIINCIQHQYQQQYQRNTQVFWIGMSMGGMLAYAYGQTKNGQNKLKGAVTIGSPISFEYSKSFFSKLKRLAPRNMYIKINLRSFLENNPFMMNVFIQHATNPDHIDSDMVKKYIELGFDNSISSKILSHFGVFFRHKDFCRYPHHPWVYDTVGKTPYLKKYTTPHSWKENISLFKTPLLAITGGADEEAPPKEVQYAVDHVRSKDVSLLDFSKGSSYSTYNYKHLDFHLGIKAKDEVYPHIYNWIMDRI